MECEYDVDVPIGRVTSTVVPSGRGVAGSKKRYSVLRVAFGPYEVRFCGRGTDLALLYEVGNRGKPRSPFPLPPPILVSLESSLSRSRLVSLIPSSVTRITSFHLQSITPHSMHLAGLSPLPPLRLPHFPCLHVAVPTISSHLQYYFHFITLLL
jgi:hypothetical protein